MGEVQAMRRRHSLFLGILLFLVSAKYTTALTNLGLDLAYLNPADFAKFWDADAKRVVDAVDEIGRVQG